jgi:hypothetical protein
VGGIEGDGGSVELGLLQVDDVLDLLVVLVGYSHNNEQLVLHTINPRKGV